MFFSGANRTFFRLFLKDDALIIVIPLVSNSIPPLTPLALNDSGGVLDTTKRAIRGQFHLRRVSLGTISGQP